MCNVIAVNALLQITGTRIAFCVAFLNRLLTSMELPVICQTDSSATTTPIVRLTYFEFFDTVLIMTVINFYFKKLRMDYSIPSLFFKAARLSAAFA